jgi:hypothetical protein
MDFLLNDKELVEMLRHQFELRKTILCTSGTSG